MLSNRIALVSGAARHTGKAIAEELIRQGATVYLTDRDEETLAATVTELGPEAHAALADLTDDGQVRQMMSAIADEAGRLDILVNNACHLGVGPSFLETPMELLNQVFAVNVRGVFLLSQLAARTMAEHGQGCIVNISSNTSQRAIRNRSAYIASKGAINSLSRAMAVELAPLGIRVNTILPGYIHTSRWDNISDDTRGRRYTNVPLGVEAMGADIAQAVAFLVSDQAANVVGAELAIDGGTRVQLYPKDCEA